MQVLNKHDKEQLVIKLHQDGKNMRQIASPAASATLGKLSEKYMVKLITTTILT